MAELEQGGKSYRTTYVSPVETLALAGQLDFDDYAKSLKLFTFAFEHLEVKVGDAWIPVKTPGRDLYAPGIDVRELDMLARWFIETVLIPAFPGSDA